MIMIPAWVAQGLSFLATLFVSAIALAVLAVVVLFVVDKTQNKDAVRHNFPVLGRFRYLFQFLGEFFRQYFFAMDREELPFNRAEREWVSRAAENESNTVAFGSTRNLNGVGTHIFVNAPFAPLDRDIAPMQSLRIGEGCRHPYDASSFFNVSGMSYGAISKPAVLALSRGAKMGGFWLNTGEGGISPYHLEGGGDLIYQMGTAKYGARNDDSTLNEEKLREVTAHEQVKMIEVKLAQGAKPGKGGILPAEKVTQEIASIRGIKAGEASISTNRHVEISNIEELLDFIVRVRDITGKPTGFKTVIGDEYWMDDLCAAIVKRGVDTAPDFITVDGGNGGTGAAPMSLMDNVGLILKEALPIVSDALHKHGLRDRVRVIASGKLINPTDVAWALAAGADFVNSARGFMFSLGCIQALKCNKNTCPTGITTHNPRLQEGLDPKEKSARVMHYHNNLVHEVEVIAHSCGVAEPRELRRKHVRIVQSTGLSIAMDKLYPRPKKVA